MLIPANDARHFLHHYKEMLERVASRVLVTVADYLGARREFFGAGHRDDPPTEDLDLRAALVTAVAGKFAVARHQARYTELVGPNEGVYRVQGVTSELRNMVASWTMVETAVMQFRGVWICDGLIETYEIHLGPNMRKGMLETIRNAVAGPELTRSRRATKAKPASEIFTEKQGQYLAYIHQYRKINGGSPSEADMQRYFRVSAPSVHQMVLTLERRGLIRRVPGMSRSISLLVPEEQLPRLR